MICIIAFYKFVSLPAYKELKEDLKTKMIELEIKGTILLASEGINSTISGTEENIEIFIKYLTQNPLFSDLQFKKSFYDHQPFGKTKVKLKKQILSLGEPIDVHSRIGIYVEPKDWNNLIKQDDLVLIDTRNDYECEIGTFEGAIDPKINNFRELADFVQNNLDSWQNKKIAMFCTGGIRCEKFSSFMLQKGFPEVYHLKGGILQYLEEIPPETSLWKGNCFVFDERRAVKHALIPA